MYNQTDLFPDIQPVSESQPIKSYYPGEPVSVIEKHPWGQKRNFKGFVQYKLNGERSWKFNIIAFGGKPLPDGTDSIGHVALYDGKTVECKMDMQDRVNVSGKWYGRNNWDH